MEQKYSLKELIAEAGKKLKSDFEEIKKTVPHHGEAGTEAEDILKEFLNDRLPKRFAAEGGFIVGLDEVVGPQTDIMIYDAINSPVYRKSGNSLILPKDNVAVVIEVKSKLTKAELLDAATKIEAIKKLKHTPVNNADQPTTFSNMTITNTLGCVFAFDSSTSLKTLAKNLKEINSKKSSNHWIDLVVVLNKGVIGYVIQSLFNSRMLGWFGGACADSFPIPPYYINLVKQDLGEMTLNKFFSDTMAHLTFFRKRSTASMKIAEHKSIPCIPIEGYQYNLKGQLVACEEFHKVGKFKNPQPRYNIYSEKEGVFIGQIGYLSWQDGASITYSGKIPPPIIYGPFFVGRGKALVIPPSEDMLNIYMSSILNITKNEFIGVVESNKWGMRFVKDSDNDNPPPLKIDL